MRRVGGVTLTSDITEPSMAPPERIAVMAARLEKLESIYGPVLDMDVVTDSGEFRPYNYIPYSLTDPAVDDLPAGNSFRSRPGRHGPTDVPCVRGHDPNWGITKRGFRVCKTCRVMFERDRRNRLLEERKREAS